MYTFQTAVKDFIHHCNYEKNLSNKTIKSYNTDLKQFMEFLISNNKSINLAKISKYEIREYIEFISGLKPKSRKRKVATLKSLFNFIEFEDKISINPFRKMKIKIKEPIELPRFLNIDEIKKLFKSAFKETTICKKNSNSHLFAIRNMAVIELLFATGARVSEISKLNVGDVDFKSGIINLKGKGNRERIVNVCNKDCLNVLNTYKEINSKCMSLEGNHFLSNRLNKRLSEQSIRNIIKYLTNKACIQKKVTPHMFRHTFATLLLEKDVDIKYIQSMLGHSSILTTQIYTHVNQEKKKKILEEKHPRNDFTLDKI